MMSESSLPSLISEILISMVNSTTSSDGCDLALNDLVNFTSNELAKHRLNQLLVDLLYANVNFNELWQGSHDYAKVFYHKPSNREEVEFYTVYDRTVLLTYVWNNSTARLIIDRKSPERDEIYGQFYVTVNSDNL